MKKFLLMLIFTISLLLTSSVNSNAQCPNCTGNFSGSATFNYNNIPNCKVQVNFCYYIDAYGFVTFEICNFVIFDFACLPTMSLNILWDNSYETIFSFVNGLTSFSYPPCENITPEMFNTEIRKAVCWNRIDYLDRVEYWPCGGEPGLCKRVFVVCKDNNNITYELISSEIVDEGNCETPPNMFFPPNSGCYNNCDF